MKFNSYDHKEVSEILLDIVNKASLKINEIYGNFEIKVKEKFDNSPVTNADIESNKIIIQQLEKHFKNCTIISEENTKKILFNKNDFFLVDPLDGTKEFINKNSEFTVNIALIKNFVPVLGVVGVPAKSLIYLSDGENSYKFSNHQKTKINIKKKNKLINLVSRSHIDEKTRDFIKEFPEMRTLKKGSSLKFCLIADGTADIYIRFGYTMEWDTAAGHAILLTSGGKVISPDLCSLNYGKKNFKNSPFLAFNYNCERVIDYFKKTAELT